MTDVQSDLNGVASFACVQEVVPALDADDQVRVVEAARFAAWLAAADEADLTWQYFADGEAGEAMFPGHLHGSLRDLQTQLIALNARGAGIFAMVNEGDGRGRSAAHVRRVRALFVDLDGAPLEPLLSCPVVPHLIVESSTGRWHAYWKVDDCALEQFKPIQRALAARFGGDPSVCDLPRVMRVPGFVHRKGLPFTTRIDRLRDVAACSVRDLVEGLGLDLGIASEVDRCEPVAERAASAGGAQTELVPEGGRHRHLVRVAGRLNGQGLLPAAILAALEAENEQRCSPPVPVQEVHAIAADIPARYAAQHGARVRPGPTAASPWPNLEPLPDPVHTEPPEFPLDALGPVLGPAARSIARIVQVPDVMAAASVLASASLAAQPLADVRLPHGVLPLSLFMMTSASSGDRKTATDNAANKVFLDMRQARARELAKLEQDYAQDRAGGQRSDRSLPRPSVDVPIVGKATVEALQRALKSQSSIGLFTSEGGEFLGGHSMRDERRASGLAWYLTAWDGGDLTDMTVTHGTSMLVGRRVAMHVLLQPVLLTKLLSDPLASQQGLIPRLLISEPKSLAGTRLYKPEDVSKDADVQNYYDVIRTLAQTEPPTAGAGDPYELIPRELCIGPAALEAWTAFYNETECEQATGRSLEGVRGFAGKVADHAARIAGVLAMVSDPRTYEVDEASMRGAIAIANFFLLEHLRLTGASIENAHLDRLRLLIDWLRTRGPSVSAKEILQHSPRAVRDLKASGIHALIEELQRRGYIRKAGEGWEVRR